MKKTYYFILFLVLSSIFIYSCSNSDDSADSNNGGSQEIIPTNLQVSLTIQGKDSENPNGDGSGVFYGIATADDAINYGFRIGNDGEETQSQSGDFSFTLTDQGLLQFPFYVYAYSSTGNSELKIINLTIDVEGNGGSGNNDVLVWSDEFNGTGSIDISKWTTETGGGGWGNQESQIYTSSSNNVRKEAGILKIKVIKESNGNFTSARIKTQDKFEFKYGRVDIRAKLPSVQGSWPALWMLGANYPDVGWPQCGEIDIMEQFENKDEIASTLHWKLPNGNRGMYGLPTANSTSTDFHIYSLEWTSTNIKTFLDGVEFFSMNISDADPYYPFNEDFFFIFNVAMGGTNGGAIDPNLIEGYVDAMEVDYIRVYQ
ncbi:MAG: glycoside hydrolase [Flavobacteriaceae bacterium]|nr:glycoside hydrolase [Flavobacteriaceae bacterium]|tara:strand:+ start:1033 stop:2148 length:1116 start_codon:yes stop_codon:yes gene_type:complete